MSDGNVQLDRILTDKVDLIYIIAPPLFLFMSNQNS